MKDDLSIITLSTFLTILRLKIRLSKTRNNMKDKLYRSRADRVFGGVASGLAKYLNLDPVLIRIIFILLAIFSGVGLLLYIIMWIVVPEDPTFYNFGPMPGKNENDSPNQSECKEETSQPYSGSADQKSNFDIPPYPVKKSNGSGRLVVGIIFIGLGLIFLADRIFPYFDFEDFLPLLFVVIGISLLWNSLKK